MAQFDEDANPLIPRQIERPRVGIGGLVFRRLIKNLRRGRFTILLPNGEAIKKTGTEDGPDATIVIHQRRALRRLMVSGDRGAAEGYTNAAWTMPDLTALIRLAAANANVLSPALSGTWIARLVGRLRHILNANIRRGNRRNIEVDYELGNELYEQSLDGAMIYSSAVFENSTQTLEAAQQDRVRRRGKSFAWVIPAIVVGAAFPAEASDINGNWARGDGNARVRIASCGADICAVDTWIKSGTTKEKDGDNLVTSINEDTEGSYSGTAFDP